MSKIIKFDNVFFHYKKNSPILQNVSFEISSDDKVSISGASGVGKTTVLRLILGLEKPKKGAIQIDDNMLMSVSFQEDRLFLHRTVLENVALFSDEKTAKNILEKLGLEDAEQKYPSELSGGMKRRVSLARALAHKFDVLILDEPFTGLDEQSKAMCIEQVKNAAQNKALILVSHSKDESDALCSKSIVL